MKHFSLRSGFTLFELLVVISIIAILVALGTVSYSTAQQNGRDSRRRGDMTGLQNALEQYYSVNSGYPDDCAAATLVSVLPNGLPTDPKNDPSNYDYTYACDGVTQTYCVCAKLERTGAGNMYSSSCAKSASGSETKDYFCVENLQ